MTQTRPRYPLALAAALSFAALMSSPARAQSTAFTYQGHLDDAGAPTSGLHDFRVNLFNAATGGVVVGPPQCADNVDVIDGVFTLLLDFGQAYATTAERHLEIQVRSDTGLACGDLSGYTTMAPRQHLTATPLASHAKSAFALDAADGSPQSAVFVDDGGRVGIGTTSPALLLHLQSAAPAPVILLQDTGSASNQAGYIGFWNNASAETGWLGFGTPGSPNFGLVNARSGGNIYLSPGAGGNVGVGTAAPAAKLDVRGDIKLGPGGQYHATGGEERLRVIRGKVSAAGVVLLGSGFSASRVSAGTYLVGFSPNFSATPVVTVSAEWLSGTAYTAMTNGVLHTATGVRITNGSGSLVDRDFYFFAIGPR